MDTVVRKHISKDGLENSAAKLIPRNSIAIVTRVGLGKVSLISYDYSTSQDFLSISELNIDKLFGAYVISDLMKKESRLAQGTSIKGITKNEVLEKLIFTPSLKEQTAIGNFFRQLDAAIASHQRKPLPQNTSKIKQADAISACFRLAKPGQMPHHNIGILIFKFLNNMDISVLCGGHARMPQSSGHAGNRHAGKKQ